MKIVVINKDKLENIPPLISVIYHLNNLGHSVHVITTGYGEGLDCYFKNNNIKTTIISSDIKHGVISKLIDYFRYRQKVLKLLKQFTFDCIWIEGGNTVLALGTGIRQYKYVLQISELYEKSPKMFKAIGKVIRQANAVVLPEYNRSMLYKIWFSLNKRPFVLPNIPAFLPDSDTLESLESKYRAQLEKLENKTVILYQGHIGKGRDLSIIAKAIQELGSSYLLLLVGKDHNKVNELKTICDSIMHVDFIPAPDYLIFTKHSDIGILSYDATSINNIYCAPNKLFEYASFGLPMLGNDIPGLKYMIEPYSAGIIIDETDKNNIKAAIKAIANNKELYAEGSKRLFNSFDNLTTISQIISSINAKENTSSN